jgi:RNA polymerase sigma-70 factor (sigma-E family)
VHHASRTPSAEAAESLDSFTAYVTGHRPALVRAAYRLTGEHHSAEDLVQCALASAYSAWPGIRDPRAVDAYVRRSLVNQHASWWRQRWRTTERSCETPPEPRQQPGGGAAPVLHPAADVSDAWLALWQLVQGLPPKQRAAVVLRYYQDMSELDAARTLGCSVGTVKSNTSRGVAALRAARRRLPDPNGRQEPRRHPSAAHPRAPAGS